MKVIVRKPRLTSRYVEILRFVAVAMATALTIVGLGFVGSYAGARAACTVAFVPAQTVPMVTPVGVGNPPGLDTDVLIVSLS